MEQAVMEAEKAAASLPPRVIITFKRIRVEESDESSSEDIEDPLPLSKSKEGHQLSKRLCHKPQFSNHSEGSSEGDTGFVRPPQAYVEKSDLLSGLTRKCHDCKDRPEVLARWCPNGGRKPSLPDAPTFYPNAEEFKNPLKYITSIRPCAEQFGICRIVPPQTWRPPCPLQERDPGTLQFPTRVQQIHKLQKRAPLPKVIPPKKNATVFRRKRRKALYSLEKKPAVSATNSFSRPQPSATPAEQQEVFGFEPGRPSSLAAFEKYAVSFQEQYFQRTEGRSDCPSGSTGEQKWEPSVDIVEGEYWRIVEQSATHVEVLYGADVETGTFGSGFPKQGPGVEGDDEYTKSGWNLNNIARVAGSMLGFEEGDIQGVLVPWLYIGMCFSSFCWHVEDHHFYSINRVHWGAPKVWYGVPSYAAQKLVAAMKKHLPDLFIEQPDLLHKLVTQLSPSILKEEGVPVYRLVQQPGDFVVTFPRAYHSGFNCGFNVAEAVNMAPVDWLPHGQSAAELYREQRRKTTISHDKLLLGAARLAAKMFWLSHQNAPQEGVPNSKFKLECEGPDGKIETLDPLWVATWVALCGREGILAKALKVRVDIERARRTAIQTKNLNPKKMDGSHDTTEEQECEICKYDLHLSAVSCESHPDKFSCLLHAALFCPCPASKKTVLFRYDIDELELLLAAVELQPGAIANWAKQEGLLLPASSLVPAKELPSTAPDEFENDDVAKQKQPPDAGCENSRVARAGVSEDVCASIQAHGLLMAQTLPRLERQTAPPVPHAGKCGTDLVPVSSTSNQLPSAEKTVYEGSQGGAAHQPLRQTQTGVLNGCRSGTSAVDMVASLPWNTKRVNVQRTAATISKGHQSNLWEDFRAERRPPPTVKGRSSVEASNSVSRRQPFSIRTVALEFANVGGGASVSRCAQSLPHTGSPCIINLSDTDD